MGLNAPKAAQNGRLVVSLIRWLAREL